MIDQLRTDDIQLTAADIGKIENVQQVDDYAGSATTWMRPSALATRRWAWRCRPAPADQADPPCRPGPADSDIVIDLFEVRSVTVKLTQNMARRFRERPESVLLVLTKDYEKLDFVLVEREVASSRSRTASQRQIIRPRTLTVDRRNPTRWIYAS